MKKIILSAFLLIALSFSAFAGFFDNRYFEVRVDLPLEVSNSSIFAADIFKEELVIDLPAMAESMPKSGFSFNIFSVPAVNVNLDLRFLYIGLKAGLDLQSTLGISRDIFDFLGKGNELNQVIEVIPTFDTDLFLFVDATVGFNIKKFKIKLIPAVFFPVIHTALGTSNIKIQNTDTGAMVFDMDAGIDLYSPLSAGELETLKTGNFEFTRLFSSVGFDFAGSMQVEVLKGFDLCAYLKMPVVPAKLTNKVSANVTCNTDINLIGMASGGGAPNFKFNFSPFTSSESDLKINRPLRAMVGIDWTGFGKWFRVYADGGLGVRYPFTADAKFYPEYILGLDLSLFNIIGLSLRSQYLNMVFSHRLDIFLNVRIFELNLGVATESSTFTGTFKIGGLGLFLGLSVGF